MSSTAFATEDVLIIETPERVPLHFALASIGNRFLACALDHFLQALALVLMFLAFYILANVSSFGDMVSSAPKWVFAIMIVVLFLIFSSYFAFFEWIWNGQTPGKRLLKLRVIREDGRGEGDDQIVTVEKLHDLLAHRREESGKQSMPLGETAA